VILIRQHARITPNGILTKPQAFAYNEMPQHETLKLVSLPNLINNEKTTGDESPVVIPESSCRPLTPSQVDSAFRPDCGTRPQEISIFEGFCFQHLHKIFLYRAILVKRLIPEINELNDFARINIVVPHWPKKNRFWMGRPQTLTVFWA
jgi:hypothetical protein